MSASFDVAVVGGGPAGLAAALAAARGGASVVLFEPRGRSSDKPCGEGVLPRGVRVLAELDAAPRANERRAFRRLAYWIGGARALALELDSDAWAIERPALLAGLERALDEAPARVLRVERRASLRRAGGRFAVDVYGASDAERAADSSAYDAAVVVAATGALARGDADRRTPRTRAARVGVRARFVACGELDGVEVHLGRGCEVYLTPLAGGRVNVAVLLDDADGDANALLARALAAHPAAARVVGAVATEPVSMPIRAGWRRLPGAPDTSGVLACGDALACVDPILGAGVGLALESGRLAGERALRVLAGEAHVRASREHREDARGLARRSMWAARLLLALARRERLAGSVARALAARPSLARACVRFATADPREERAQPPSARARRSVPWSHSSS